MGLTRSYFDFYVGFGWLSGKYVFWVPLIMNAVIALLLGIAFLRWQRDDSRSLIKE
jgi:hypothetical protein